MTLIELYQRAESEGIKIYDRRFEEVRAIALPNGCIGIDRLKYLSETDYKCDLAHEIGHIETGSFYNYYSPFDLWEKCERKANRRAAEILMPIADVLCCMRKGVVSVYALAQAFDVTIDFASTVIQLYETEIMWYNKQEQIVGA